ncbi:MAG: filamentous hemagglutinin N-terminal domain-containing protein [Phycisphaerales bacterium]|nr:filamentous hemagglutinin N-terminal domain-containing protein [Phycisphaerales bacterium]
MATQKTNMKRLLFGLLIAAGTTGMVAGYALATPEGGDVIEGEADIDYGDWTRVVTGEITIIQWLSFQIAAGETVEFIMPSETSRVLNLINSGVPTEIMGSLIGNGQIFLVNPSGVIFGQGSVVNVGALYAAAGNISNTDFMNGVYRFTDARGVVENRGMLQGDLIALIGGRVANHGTISAPGGTVILAAGEQVLIGEHLGHVFVQLERPTDLANTDQLSDPGYEGVGLTAGDVFSLAAWNTGTIDAAHTTVAVSAGHMAIDHSIAAEDITLIAQGDSHIQLGADLNASGDGIFIEGDLVLSNDVEMSLTGDIGIVDFGGSIDSAEGAEHDLVIDAGSGVVAFHGGVGQNDRLGVLDVTALRAEVYRDIAVNQEMNFYAPVAVMGDLTIFDVGFGTALFADNLYSSVDGMSDVAFVYDGQAWVGQGQARTPFKFRGGIGIAPALSGSVSGAFRNIHFGGDLNNPSRVSAFLFGTGAMAGLELMSADSVDLGYLFQVSARESIVMGRGQKMLSFGSLSLNAKGNGMTLIEIGDLNVLGDLRVISQGRSGGVIRILDRVGGEVDFAGNESDRDLDGLFDQNTELIASGSIVLDGELVFDADVTLGASEVFLLNNTGLGDGGGLDIGLFPGGVSLDLFRGVLGGTGDLLYPYDLALSAQSEPDDSLANLAEAFADEGDLRVRTDEPLLAGREVLFELLLNPRDPSMKIIRNGIRDGATRFDESSAADFGITIDRLTRSSVVRLTETYVSLLGDRLTDDSVARVRDERVSKAVGWLWIQTNGQEIESIFAYAAKHDRNGFEWLHQIKYVLDAIELLELTPLEIERTKLALLGRLKPEIVPMDEFAGWFNH